MRKYLKCIAVTIPLALALGGCANALPSTETKSASAGSTETSESLEASNAAGSTGTSDSSGTCKITEKNVKFYLGDLSNEKELTLYFVNDGSIPYISMDDIFGMMKKGKYEASTDDSGDHTIITISGTKYNADFDFANDTIYFFDYDAFFKDENGPLVDIGTLDVLSLSEKMETLTNDRYGREQTFDLKKYDIDLVRDGDNYYIPLQTFSDVILSYSNLFTVYNGEAVFLTNDLYGDMEAEYYKAAPQGTLPEDLALFSYNELRFALDHLYGLKEVHNITSFDTFFREIGVEKRLKGTDVLKKDKAMFEFITCYLDDLHSSFNNNSYLVAKSDLKEKIAGIYGPSKENYKNDRAAFSEARKNAFGEEIPPYQEVGNTAYITFDEFTDPSREIDYTTQPKEDELSDTIRLMQYACEKILRPGSPVKNVVLDLSLNGGGACASASYVIGTYLGTGEMNTINTLTGATTTLKYRIDTNRDGVFDENDTLAGKGLNLYCITSPVSFSCGNFVPSAFVYSPHITLLGRTSGGGSCTVQPLSTAYGCAVQISGSKRMSVFKNGSFYDIDRGATPDYPISKIADFYDRKKLTDYINGLV